MVFVKEKVKSSVCADPEAASAIMDAASKPVNLFECIDVILGSDILPAIYQGQLIANRHLVFVVTDFADPLEDEPDTAESNKF